MYGSRPDLFQLRQLILVIFAAVIVTGAIAILAGVIFCSASDGFSQSAATAITIAKMDVGAPPAGFQFARTGQGDLGRWIVVSDESSFGGRAIEQSSTDRTDYRFPLAILNSVVAKNVDVSLKFKPVAGRVDQAGGIAVRVLDGDNYYVVRANALEDNVRFYRVVKGRRQQIDGVNTKVSSGEWHSLGLKAQEDHFTIAFDGRTLFTTSDTTFAGAGKVALWTKADSVTRFDQIAIDVLPQEQRR
jgi:hypothetical protein